MSQEEKPEKDPAQLSIIITYFNEGVLILNAIRSCFGLGLDSIEIIVIDDGSEDGLTGILEQLTPAPKNLILHRQKNQGVSVARNTGMTLAKGAWLTFLDADDQLEACNLGPILKSNHQVIRAEFNDSDNTPSDTIARLPDREVIPGWEHLASMLESNAFRPTCCGYIYSRSWLQAIGKQFNTALTHSEDSLFIIEALLEAPKTSATSTKVYRYNRREGSATTARSIDQITKRLLSMQLFLRRISKLHRKTPEARLDIYIKDYWNYMFSVSLRTRSRRCRLMALQSQLELLVTHHSQDFKPRQVIPELKRAANCLKSVLSTSYISTASD